MKTFIKTYNDNDDFFFIETYGVWYDSDSYDI